MSFEYGFYNSIDHDRLYDARDFSRVFDGVINDGVYMSIGDKLFVKSNGNMTVVVGSGRAWFNGTWSYNDTDYLLNVPVSNQLMDRIDTVVLEVNEETRENTLKIISGTASANPLPPTLTNTATVHQHPLANILVQKSALVINDADITNKVGTSECPFVTGIIQTINIDALINQWEAQWVDWKNATQSGFETWRDTNQSEFEEWLANIERLFEGGDIATNHEIRIEKLETNTTITAETMLASGWSNGVYSFENDYPKANYNIEIEPNGDSITAVQLMAWSKAQLVGSVDNNTVKAMKTVPTVDIPIIVKAVLK